MHVIANVLVAFLYLQEGEAKEAILGEELDC